MKYKILLILIIFAVKASFAQYIPEHISNEAIYTFLDELASAKLITINAAVKPFSKAFIAQKLVEASTHKDQLSKRQAKELDFYLRAYRPDLESPAELGWQEKLNIFKKQPHLATSLDPFALVYKDSLFTFCIRPVYGISVSRNENGSVNHTWGGLEAYSTIAGHWGIYASLRDNHEDQILARPAYFTQETGGAYKVNEGGRKGGDFSEMRGGITYAWKWGDIGLVKDHFEWGTNYHGSNIFSGRTPSFAHIRLHLHPAKWIDFNYVHGWLVSEVIDSSRSYYNNGQYRAVFRQKFLAANMLTIIPFKYLDISAGNSIVYSDLGGVHPAYLIPLAFYKSIDHTLNHNIDNQNSQMFFNISSRQVKNLHLYTSVYVDEFSVTRIRSKTAHNFISWKGGFNLSNAAVKDITFTAEFTQTAPITYKHRVPAITFESNQYNLGHYLRDNSRELYLSLSYSPLPRLHTRLSYTMAEHGNEYAYTERPDIADLPMLTDFCWKETLVEFTANYEFVNNGYLFAGFRVGNVQGSDLDGQAAQYYLDRFTAPFYQGKTNTLTVGFNLGF